jgi:hypothetical protein
MFTMTLLQPIQQSKLLYTRSEAVLRHASSTYVVAGSLKTWFEVLLADGVDRTAMEHHVDVQITQVFDRLIQNVYGFII